MIHETAITIDHDLKKVFIDTNSKGVASKLKSRGFKEVTTKNSLPYRRFLGTPRQISFRGANKKVVKKS